MFRELGDAQALYDTVADEVFPFIKTLGEGAGRDGADATYSAHMKDARFTIPTPALLAKVVDVIDRVPMADRDTKGDVYEYMLSKIASAGQNGQFRTPRHIIKLMVDMMAPTPADTICDPACGTAGFLVAASEYLTDHHQAEIYGSEDATRRFNHDTFHGFDFDSTMLRIGSMNMLLHGVENPAIGNRDSLSENHAAVAANSAWCWPIRRSPARWITKHGQRPAGDGQDQEDRTAVSGPVPAPAQARRARRRDRAGRRAIRFVEGPQEPAQELIEDQKLEAVIAMPSGVFKPYAGVSTAILVFTKTKSGGTDHVWFYEMQADGFSLDDKRTPLTPNGARANTASTTCRTFSRVGRTEKQKHERERTEQSFLVPKAEIAGNEYDLSINRYKEIVYEEVEYDPPAKILSELRAIEHEISAGLDELETLLDD